MLLVAGVNLNLRDKVPLLTTSHPFELSRLPPGQRPCCKCCLISECSRPPLYCITPHTQPPPGSLPTLLPLSAASSECPPHWAGPRLSWSRALMWMSCFTAPSDSEHLSHLVGRGSCSAHCASGVMTSSVAEGLRRAKV